MPDFETVYGRATCEMLQDAYDAITKCDLWDWMREFNPHPNEGFMFCTHPNLLRINDEMKYQGHSGASYAGTMRTMEAIAKSGGWEAYKASVIAKWPENRPVCACRLKQGLSYGWCGVAGGGVPGCEH